MKVTLLFILFIINNTLSLSDPPLDFFTHSSVVKCFNRYYNSLRLYIGSGYEKNKENIDMEISLGRSNTLIGLSSNENVKWGVECSEEGKDNTCQIQKVNNLLSLKYNLTECKRRCSIYLQQTGFNCSSFNVY